MKCSFSFLFNLKKKKLNYTVHGFVIVKVSK